MQFTLHELQFNFASLPTEAFAPQSLYIPNSNEQSDNQFKEQKSRIFKLDLEDIICLQAMQLKEYYNNSNLSSWILSAGS